MGAASKPAIIPSSQHSHIRLNSSTTQQAMSNTATEGEKISLVGGPEGQ